MGICNRRLTVCADNIHALINIDSLRKNALNQACRGSYEHLFQLCTEEHVETQKLHYKRIWKMPNRDSEEKILGKFCLNEPLNSGWYFWSDLNAV